MEKILLISLKPNFTPNILGGLNPELPKVFGVRFSLRDIGRIFFSLKYAILSFGRCLNN